jgi:tetratricopeptide (TPR) repeat protein
MASRRVSWCPILLAAAGCAAPPPVGASLRAASAEELRAQPVRESARVAAAELVAGDAASVHAASGVGSDRVADDALAAVFSSPAFRQQFAASYVADTEIEPRVEASEREPLQEILELVATGRLEEAADLMRVRRAEGASAVFDFLLGNVHFQREELEPAVAAYQAAVARFPRFRRAWGQLAVCLVRRGDFEAALPALTQVIQLGGGSAAIYGTLGVACANTDDHVAAEAAFRMAILLDPQAVAWRIGLAESLFKQERFADVSALCQRLIADDPDRVELWMLQANAFVRLGRPLEAAKNLELVERLGKSTPDTLGLLGDIYTNEQLFDLAARCYADAAERSREGSPQRAIRAARDLALRGATTEARALVERIEGLFAERLDNAARKELLRVRARLSVAEGAGDEEARVLQELVDLDPLDGEALILLGQVHKRAGDPERAILAFERAASLASFEAEAKLRHGELLVGLGHYAEALPLLRRAQVLAPRESVQRYLEDVEQAAKSR